VPAKSPETDATLSVTGSANDEDLLFAWIAETCRGEIVRKVQASGGNRRRSWAVDVRVADGNILRLFLRHDPRRTHTGVEPYTVAREAEIYRTIAPISIKAPRLVAAHDDLRGVLTDRAPGIAEFRYLKDPVEKQAIAGEFMDNMAALHRFDARNIAFDGGAKGRIIDHVTKEVTLWRAMYEEVGQPDPLLDLAFGWLEGNMPDPDEPPVIVHGDAGPGNFMFHEGHLTTLIDWEFTHLGDPMEDIAWFSMRCVMEPVPDFQDALRHYERAGGWRIHRARLLYHRVLVSTRVCVIRHRNFASEPAHAIVSRGLNRRLLVEALSAASGISIPMAVPVTAPEGERAWLYDRVINDLGNIIVPQATDKKAIAAAKNAAKVIKYLKAIDQLGPAVDEARLIALAAVLGQPSASLKAGQDALSRGLCNGTVPFGRALAYFAADTMWGAQLSAEASGSIAHRHYQEL